LNQGGEGERHHKGKKREKKYANQMAKKRANFSIGEKMVGDVLILCKGGGVLFLAKENPFRIGHLTARKRVGRGDDK